MGRLKTLLCPACGCERQTKAEGRQMLSCSACGHQFLAGRAAELASVGAA